MKRKSLIALTVGALALGGCNQQNVRNETVKPAEPVVETLSVTTTALAAGMPVWRVGQWWTYSDGYGLKVTEVDGGLTTFARTDAEGQWVVREGPFKMESQSATTHRKVVFRSADPVAGLFPLEADKQVTFTREYLADGKLRRHRTSWTVEGRDTITVPAGEFDCWVLAMRTRSVQSDWTGFERWWYSPKAGNFVRMEYQYGVAPASSRVLMALGDDSRVQRPEE